jgi:hypothetical protein
MLAARGEIPVASIQVQAHHTGFGDLLLRVAGRADMDIRRTSDSGRAVSLPILAVDRSRHELKEIVLRPVRRIRRLPGVLAGALLAFAAAALALSSRKG